MTDKIKPCPSISLPDDMANDLQSFKEAESHRNGHPSPTRARLFEIIDFLLAAHAPKQEPVTHYAVREQRVREVLHGMILWFAEGDLSRWNTHLKQKEILTQARAILNEVIQD